jgi:predicted flap endonuclease-1-like 5' DNA nuclease
MAEEEKVQPEAETKKPEPPPPRFKITNVVRRVGSRLRRYAAPGRRRFKQFVCGKRLLRKQSVLVTPEEMEKHQERLYEQVREGAIEITAPDGSVLSADVRGNLISRKGMEVTVVDEAKVTIFLEQPGRLEKLAKGGEPKAETPEVTVEEAEPPHPPPATPPDPAKEMTSQPPSDTPKPDDLTGLQGVGPGRARKLVEAGITTFKQIAETSPAELARLLGSPATVPMAAAIRVAASKKGG